MPSEEWLLVPTELFIRRHKEFSMRRPMQLKAVLENLARYKEMLNHQPIARLVSANFIHPEGRGIVALTEKGSKPKQPPTRLYVFPVQNSKTLNLITIGDKRTQREDIKDCYKHL
jgi:hypothetical protein